MYMLTFVWVHLFAYLFKDGRINNKIEWFHMEEGKNRVKGIYPSSHPSLLIK